MNAIAIKLTRERNVWYEYDITPPKYCDFRYVTQYTAVN